MTLNLDPDRLFPADSATRTIARDLYGSVQNLPILSPHGHVDPALLLGDTPFANAAELFIRYDHYVTRLMHAAGVPLTDLGIPDRTSEEGVAAPRDIWRTFCAHWYLYAGTASGYWLQHAFGEQFGITQQPSPENADALFDQIHAALATDAFRPRALFDEFGIDVLATTDDPMDDLAAHRRLAADDTFAGRVLPTFRPDAYVDPAAPGFADNVAKLADWNGSAVSSYRGYIDAWPVAGATSSRTALYPQTTGSSSRSPSISAPGRPPVCSNARSLAGWRQRSNGFSPAICSSRWPG